MRWLVLIVLLSGGCIDQVELTGPAPCDTLVVPEQVAVGVRFSVEVSCPNGDPEWFDYDFGDDTEIVRTASAVREHVYGDDVASNFQFRVRVFYRDDNGELHDLEATIARDYLR